MKYFKNIVRPTVVTACLIASQAVWAQSPTDTPISQMEKLDRGVVVIPRPGSSGNYFLSWRLLGTDTRSTSFEVLKNGSSMRKNIYGATSMQVTGNAETTFQVVTLQDGVPVDTTNAVRPWSQAYLRLQLDRPAGGSDYSYTPNDCSVGDVDGDGQYELFVKWDPTNSKDNSQNGVTGNVYIDCYKLDGTKLWRIDLGKNIRAGAHYTQFMVFDFDGDGQAEMICKTGPGTLDGTGHYVSQAATEPSIQSVNDTKDWRNSNGRIVGGQEWLTVFKGATGEAIHTIFYNPNRDQGYGGEAPGNFNWGDVDKKSDKASYGNRGERFLAAVAYLSGPDARPSGIFSRGYYGYAFVWAVDFDGQHLSQRWLHASKSNTQYSVTTFAEGDNTGTTATFTPGACSSGEGRNTMFANGNHNLSVADVDGDGKDEIIWGSAALDDDGKLLYSVGFGHGDAIHLADLNPDRPGLELFDIHEDKGTYAWDLHDAATGEIIFKGGQSGQDNGRGLAADIVADSRGHEFWSSYGGMSVSERDQNPYNAITGGSVGTRKPSMNFRIYWDGDEFDELLDGTTLSKYNTDAGATTLGVGLSSLASLGSPASCNSTKATPCLQADIFGDWREEVILWNRTDSCSLNIYSTIDNTSYRVPTLMHDHVYRMGIAWQNVAYNQPPHLGYYLPDYIESFLGADPADIQELTADSQSAGSDTWHSLQGIRVNKPTRPGIYINRGRKVLIR